MPTKYKALVLTCALGFAMVSGCEQHEPDVTVTPPVQPNDRTVIVTPPPSTRSETQTQTQTTKTPPGDESSSSTTTTTTSGGR
jgi:hypothetical protein